MVEERHKIEILYNEEKESLRNLGQQIAESEFSVKRLLNNLQELRKTETGQDQVDKKDI